MSVRNTSRAFFLILFLFCTHALQVYAQPSELWGKSGEKWSPSGRLPDFSFAGYQSSRISIPNPPVTANVKDFGAKGDGRTDDSEAFLNAIDSAKRGAILIPKGTYKITQVLRIARRGIVLRGEGVDETILSFPKPLEDVLGSGKEFSPSGSWSWDGGFIWFEGGENRGVFVADVTAPALRGETTFRVSDTERFHKGQRVRLVMVNTDGSLGHHLHADKGRGSSMLMGKTLIDFSCMVVSVGQGEITIDRPLRVDVRLHWRPIFETDVPVTEDVGVENLTISFPEVGYPSHHDEPGYNGITFQTVHNGWVRNVRILNCDSGVIFRSGSKFCTIEKLELLAGPKRKARGWEGHHGVEIADRSQDNLITDFKINARFIHAFSVTSMASGNVMSNGQGVDLTFDHHRKAPYANLYTQIHAGKGTDIWYSGGDEEAGPPSGGWETFWNITADNPQALPEWATWINVVGLSTGLSSNLNKKGNWLEAIAPESLTPANLFEAQLEKRFKRAAKPQ